MRKFSTLTLSVGLSSALLACGSSAPSSADSSSMSGGAAGAGIGANASTGGVASGGSSSSGGSAQGGSTPNGGSGDTTGGAGAAMTSGPRCPEQVRGAWLAIASSNAPTPRTNEWVIPTDDGMLVWGGLGLGPMGAASAPYFDNGAIYHLCDGSWSPMSSVGAPTSLAAQTPRSPSLGLWTSGRLIVWGGIEVTAIFNGYPEGTAPSVASLYDAPSDTWRDMSRSGEPTARAYEARVWTGNELLVWGGVAQSGDKIWANHQDGARFDPASNHWTPINTTGAPAGRATMNQYVWTGSKFIVWGGLRFDSGAGFDPAYVTLSDGGVYDVASDSWTTIAAQDAPTHAPAEVFWTGSKMLVLGLLDGTTPGAVAFDGALFDPAANRWSKMSAPDASLASDFVWSDGSRKTFWTGSALVILGERINNTSTPRASGVALVYDPMSDRWRSANLPASPPYGTWQVAELIDGKIVFGGSGPSVSDVAGAAHRTTQLSSFDPDTLAFSELPLLGNRSDPSLVGSAHHVLVWGGRDTYTDLNAPNPCQNAAGPCDPITPTLSKLRGDGLALGL